MYIYKLDFFPSVVILFVHLEWQLSPSTGDQDHSYSSTPSQCCCCCLCIFFFMSCHSKMDIAVGSTSGCSVFVMHCLSSALISLSVQHGISTQETTEIKRMPREGEKWTTMSWNASPFPFSGNIFCHIPSLLPLESVFVLKKKKKKNSFIFVQYVFHLYLHDSSEMVSCGHLLALQQHF